jgi:hypothetical protein
LFEVTRGVEIEYSHGYDSTTRRRDLTRSQKARIVRNHIWLCDVGVGEVETSSTGDETNDLSGELWLVIGLFTPASEIFSGRNASCVSPIIFNTEKNCR